MAHGRAEGVEKGEIARRGVGEVASEGGRRDVIPDAGQRSISGLGGSGERDAAASTGGRALHGRRRRDWASVVGWGRSCVLEAERPT